MCEKPRRYSAATGLYCRRARSNKNVRTTGAWCSPDWMEPGGVICIDIRRHTAGGSFKRAPENVLGAEVPRGWLAIRTEIDEPRDGPADAARIALVDLLPPTRST